MCATLLDILSSGLGLSRRKSALLSEQRDGHGPHTDWSTATWSGVRLLLQVPTVAQAVMIRVSASSRDDERRVTEYLLHHN